jgi:nicotinamide-nucleotide amidase
VADRPAADASDVVAGLVAQGLTIATGESLTAGLVAATLAQVPGCSAVLRGAIVAYQPDVKAALLGVSAEDLRHGLVSEAVACAMARGVADALKADIGVGTTGVAGPDPHDGEPVGSTWVAVCVGARCNARHLVLTGDRDAIRRQTVEACFELVLETLAA